MTKDEFRSYARRAGGVDRRLFMAYVASLTAAPALRAADVLNAPKDLGNNPFTLGVASGDPAVRSVLLWTRLAPEPLEPGGGMPTLAVPVRWEVAEDDQFKRIVKSGQTVATPQLGHSVHVAVDELNPNRWYHYRFLSGDATSPVGRTRTMPNDRHPSERFKFAFASCQHFESGYYAAYRHMAEQDLDMVVHLGDYIYEGPGKEGGVRKHVGKEIQSLDDYRIRHALYKTDPQLQAMHAACPWMVTWDDHEFDNNYAAEISEQADIDPIDFLARRANSYQAYYESMPLRRRSLPQGPHMRLYRKVSFGNLAEMMVLDTRQYRSDQPQGDGKHDLNDAARSVSQSMLGAEQRGWLESSLLASPAKWNILAQQVMMATVDLKRGEKQRYSMDQWPGYLHERDHLVNFLGDRRVSNPVVLTGDIHANWVNDLRADDLKPESPVVATEFVGTSISSGGNGPSVAPDAESVLAENPGVKFLDRQRGYVACDVTADEWNSHYYIVDDVTKPDSEVSRLASFLVESGRPGAVIH
ncbi:alkaline phosphatase D family protein [Aeoliella sp. SH292]|uniref:alkaline phosphatase D family protein n=1 Tax=Aeoliella sp. SH292 TaxID=3454464 RepID=UPI003F9A6E4E